MPGSCPTEYNSVGSYLGILETGGSPVATRPTNYGGYLGAKLDAAGLASKCR